MHLWRFPRVFGCCIHPTGQLRLALATDPLGPLPQGWDAAELAALTSVSNVILNLDEFLTRN